MRGRSCLADAGARRGQSRRSSARPAPAGPSAQRWVCVCVCVCNVCMHACMHVRTLGYVMLCYVMLCYVMLCHLVSLYVCMHACMHVCMHVCMYACMHVCMYACMYACMHVCMHARMHVCTYARMHVCMYACMHACMHVCMHACLPSGGVRLRLLQASAARLGPRGGGGNSPGRRLHGGGRCGLHRSSVIKNIVFSGPRV